SDNSNRTYAGRVLGSGAFTKVGTGTLTLRTASAGNAWLNTGGTNINGGTLMFDVSPNGTFANLTDTGTVTVGAAGTFDMNNISDTEGALSGAGHVINMSGLTFAGTANTTWSGSVDGSGSILKDTPSTGKWVVTGSNTYAGTTTISGGTVQIGNN